MLSIRFSGGREWWASSEVFDRLFGSALDQGVIPVELEVWRHIAAANGGFHFKEDEAEAHDRVLSGLRAAARHDIAGLDGAEPGSVDEGYRISLERFLAATE